MRSKLKMSLSFYQKIKSDCTTLVALFRGSEVGIHFPQLTPRNIHFCPFQNGTKVDDSFWLFFLGGRKCTFATFTKRWALSAPVGESKLGEKFDDLFFYVFLLVFHISELMRIRLKCPETTKIAKNRPKMYPNALLHVNRLWRNKRT